MERREKVEFILEQMRLGLLKKDFIRTQIISKKISTRFFDSDEQHDLKLRFYDLMLSLAQNDSECGPLPYLCVTVACPRLFASSHTILFRSHSPSYHHLARGRDR